MSPSLSETSDWLDGPKLVEWLGRYGLERSEHRLSEDHIERLRRWGKGGKANVYVVDEILIRLGRHLSELPDSLFLAVTARNGGMAPERREQLLRGLLSGAPLKAIAREVGCAVSTVRYHRNRLQSVS